MHPFLVKSSECTGGMATPEHKDHERLISRSVEFPYNGRLLLASLTVTIVTTKSYNRIVFYSLCKFKFILITITTYTSSRTVNSAIPKSPKPPHITILEMFTCIVYLKILLAHSPKLIFFS